jgi:Ca-activated chloride channel family protein
MFRRWHAVPLALMAWAFLSVAPSGQSQTAAPGPAGVTITGSVVDAALTPLANVVVTLEQGGKTTAKTTTDAAGAFRFANVAPGDYRVRAERAGFPVLTRDFRVPSSATVIQLPLILVRPGEPLPETKMADVTGVNRSAATNAPPPASQSSAGFGGAGGGGRGGGGTASYMPPAPAPPSMAQEQAWMRDAQHRDAIDTPWSGFRYPHGREGYAHVAPNQFQSTYDQPLSTFGADVDTASYTNIRRILTGGHLPPRDAVRVEEFVNYFHFAYDQPRDGRPIAITTEVGDCPWAPSHKLVLIGARAKAESRREIAGRNIVLLIDVSGSMQPAERLPLIKSALAMFVETLQPDDRLAIVTYAGSSGVALPSTPARYRDVIQRAIAGLSAGGSTNGGQGLIMAYRVAREAFIPGGVNRVILATDGDFNVGIVSQSDLLHLIAREKDSGVFLSVFGVGSGNLQDRTMEMLADRGNGHYAYLDSLQEARRVLIREGDATLETVAKDVKFQVEFNPAMASAWKLIGYENRLMAAQDFNDDRKDGGEMGAGHTVTVLYEVVPAWIDERNGEPVGGRPQVDPLKYQVQPQIILPPAPRPDPAPTGEWLTVKARYKAPEGEVSDLLVRPVKSGGRVQHLPLASAIAEFGLMLQSGSRDGAAWDELGRRLGRIAAPAGMAADVDGLRELVAIAGGLSRLR